LNTLVCWAVGPYALAFSETQYQMAGRQNTCITQMGQHPPALSLDEALARRQVAGHQHPGLEGNLCALNTLGLVLCNLPELALLRLAEALWGRSSGSF
jgi:hypothetical protein